MLISIETPANEEIPPSENHQRQFRKNKSFIHSPFSAVDSPATVLMNCYPELGPELEPELPPYPCEL
jgi:hypothetical protein